MQERGEDLATIKGELTVAMTLRWTRQLYDWYCSKLPQSKPIVLDASDMLTNPRILTRLCDLVGLQAQQLCFQWEPAGPEEIRQTDPTTVQMISTLLSSAGIIADRSVSPYLLDIERQIQVWNSEFGESEGETIAVWVTKLLGGL